MIYDQLAVRVDGKLLAENVKVDIKLDKTDQDVFTVIRASLAGVTPGPSKVVATLDNVVPVTGFEFKAWTSALNTTEHAVQYIQMGSGLVLNSKASVRAVQVGAGVGETQKFNFEFHGDASDWQ